MTPSAGDFAPLVGLSKHTLYLWKKRFAQQGPAGLMEQPRGVSTGSRLSEVAKRTIVMLKQLHPDWGCQRIGGWLPLAGNRQRDADLAGDGRHRAVSDFGAADGRGASPNGADRGLWKFVRRRRPRSDHRMPLRLAVSLH